MKRKETVGIVVAVLIGALIQFANPIVALLLMGLMALLSFVSACLLIGSIFLGRKAIKWALVAAIPVAVAFVFTFGVRHYKHAKANQIVAHLKNYKKAHGCCPSKLREVTTVSLNGLNYQVDRKEQTYRIEYLMDGFNREYYESENAKWGTLGWND